MTECQMLEDIRYAILAACCPKDLKEYLDMPSEDFVCRPSRQGEHLDREQT